MRIIILVLFITTNINLIAQEGIFWTSQTKGSLFRTDLDGSNTITIDTLEPLVRRVSVDDINKKVYWIAGSSGKIKSANLDGTNKQDVITNLSTPGNLKVDGVNKLLYFHENGSSFIRKCNLDGSNLQNAITGVGDQVLGIDFDLTNNLFYWCERTTSGTSRIIRSNFSGANRSVIYTTSNLLFDLKLDVDSSRIYFSNRVGNRIQRIDTNGANIQTIINTNGTIGAISLDLCRGSIYWLTTINPSSIRKADLDGSNLTTIFDTLDLVIGGIDIYRKKRADFVPDSNICLGDSIVLNATTEGATYLWQDNSTNSTFTVKDSGVYWVDVFLNQCINRDSIIVRVPQIDLDLGSDTTLCFEDSLLLDAITLGASYLWQDSSVNSTYTVTSAGTYWVEVEVDGCFERDTINVTKDPEIIVDLGEDTSLCFQETLLLDATTQGASYLWQDSSINSTFNVTTTGIYWVDVEVNDCFKRDSIAVFINSDISVDLGADTTLCFKDSLLLDATIPDAIYLWQDSSTNSTFKVFQPGVYYVQVVDTNCNSRTALDSITVSYSPCDCDFVVPNVFTPNNDGINDFLKIKNDCDFEITSFKVFNRWGGLVVANYNGLFNWDGRVNGIKANNGVYYYLISYKTNQGIESLKKGNFTLID